MTPIALDDLSLPDAPRWVEAHGLLAEPQAWVERWPGGALIGHDEAGLGVLCGALAPHAVDELAARHPSLSLLCAPTEPFELPRRARARALLHTLPPEQLLDAPAEGAALLASSDDLTHLPPALARELSWARQRRRVWAAWVEGLPVSFAYASWRSATWFDVSVETAPGFRQLGLGALVSRALLADETAQARQPVWGATEDNWASLRMAAALGFVPHDELWVFSPQEPA